MVWEERVVCHHKLSEKCHTTFITDYRPTQERKCHTSYNKKCRISYKPSVSVVAICDVKRSSGSLMSLSSVSPETPLGHLRSSRSAGSMETI